MKLFKIAIIVACVTLAVSAFDDEEWVLEDEHDTPMMGDELVDEPVTKESTTTTTTTTTAATTTRKVQVKTAKPTTARPFVVVAEEEAPVKPKGRKQPGTARPRSSNARRMKEPEEVAVEDDTKATSPASLDTAAISILAPKNFKPTPRPINSEEDMAPKGLMEFLKKRKMERIAATTTEDPFIAILATATPPATEEPVPSKVDSNSRFSVSSKRFRGRNTLAGKTTSTSTTTTEAPIETVEVVTSRGKFTPSRFGGSKRGGSTSTTTTTEAPVVEEVKPKSKFSPKRPATLRPVSNSISRRREQATTTPAPVEEPLEEEEVVAPVTPRSFRRANARVSLRTSGF